MVDPAIGASRGKQNDNLSQIAAALGYVDHYHFARRFKIYFGCAPGTYRKRLMN